MGVEIPKPRNLQCAIEHLATDFDCIKSVGFTGQGPAREIDEIILLEALQRDLVQKRVLRSG